MEWEEPKHKTAKEAEEEMRRRVNKELREAEEHEKRQEVDKEDNAISDRKVEESDGQAKEKIPDVEKSEEFVKIGERSSLEDVRW